MTSDMLKRLEQISEEIKKLKFTHDQSCVMYDTLVTCKVLMKHVIDSDEHNSVDEMKNVLKAMYAYIATTLENSRTT